MQTAREVLALQDKTPNGLIRDADTILADIMDTIGFEETGTANELINIWLRSKDKKSVEDLFFLMTGVSFKDYLESCLNETTHSEPDDSHVNEVLKALMSAMPMQGFEIVDSDTKGVSVRKAGDWDTHIRISVEDDPA